MPSFLQRIGFRLAVWLTVAALGLVPLMQPSVAMTQLPCAQEMMAVVAHEMPEMTADAPCAEHAAKALETMVHASDHSGVDASSFHLCCSPVVGVAAQSFLLETDPVFFEFPELLLPDIAFTVEGIYRPPMA